VESQDETLAAVRDKYGFIPNLIREMSKSPAVGRVYLAGQQAMAEATLSPREQQAVQLAVSVYNECHYCRAAHRLGARLAGIAAGEIERIERGSLPDEDRLRSVVSAAWLVLDTRGWLGPTDLADLEASGIDRAQLYEVVALIALKTISNYVNHVAHTEIDPAFRA
jgi:AhpD family alkylhydroperoxidase